MAQAMENPVSPRGEVSKVRKQVNAMLLVMAIRIEMPSGVKMCRRIVSAGTSIRSKVVLWVNSQNVF